MANVFGNPITDSTLKEMAEYANKEITAVDRARVAINMKNRNAQTNVENLKKEGGTEECKYCHIYIYNATGNPMKFIRSQEWHGHFYKPYPSCIENGQWAEFWHVKDSFGSVAGVVYRGKIGNKPEDCDHMAAWSNPNEGKNSIWAETREKDHYTDVEWEKIHEKLLVPRSNHCDAWHGCASCITISNDICAEVEATFGLEAADNA